MPLEMIQIKGLTGRMPGVSRLIRWLGEARLPVPLRAGITLAGNTAEQAFGELSQGLISLSVEALGASLSKDMPGFDFGHEFRGFLEEAPSMVFQVLPMALIGTGAATIRGLRYGAAQTRDVNHLRTAGFSKAVAEKIVAEPDLTRRGELIREFWDLRTDEDIAQATDVAAQSYSHIEGIEPTEGNPSQDYELRDAEGGGVKVGPEAEARIEDTKRPKEEAVPKNPYRDEGGELRLPKFEDLRLDESYRKDWEEMRRIVADQTLADKMYDAIPDSYGGKVIGTDIARELSPLYASGREGKIAFSPPSSRLASIYAMDRLWREIHQRGDREVLIFTAGGVASGKSTVVGPVAIENADLVFDGTLRNAKWAKSAIREAIVSGWEVGVEYVQRPLESVGVGAVFRANESGRWGPVHKLAETHKAAQDSIIEIYNEFKDDDNVYIHFWINDGLTKDQPPREIGVSQIDKGGQYSYDESDEQNQERGIPGKDETGNSRVGQKGSGGVPEGRRRIAEAFRRAVESGKYEPRILRLLAEGEAEYETIVEDYLRKSNQK